MFQVRKGGEREGVSILDKVTSKPDGVVGLAGEWTHAQALTHTKTQLHLLKREGKKKRLSRAADSPISPSSLLHLTPCSMLGTFFFNLSSTFLLHSLLRSAHTHTNMQRVPLSEIIWVYSVRRVLLLWSCLKSWQNPSQQQGLHTPTHTQFFW